MEMILVMAIISLVFAGTFIGMSSLNDEKSLRKPFVDLRGLAKTAWHRSLMEQNAWEIRFFATHFDLLPRGAVNEKDARMIHESDLANGRSSGLETIPVPEGITVEVRRWAGRDWVRPTDKAPISWIFEQSGLCEPISVRFVRGEDIVGAQFDPLTGSVKEEFTDISGE